MYIGTCRVYIALYMGLYKQDYLIYLIRTSEVTMVTRQLTVTRIDKLNAFVTCLNIEYTETSERLIARVECMHGNRLVY
jgi:hypothetical protein